jgi:hypothetical protein
MADTDVRPWCIHRLRYQPARSSTAKHRRGSRNGGTSSERYLVALWSTVEQIIPPPLNQRVRGSSPWRRTPPDARDLRFLQETRSRRPRRRGVVHPWCVHRSATCLTTLISAPARHPGNHAWAKRCAGARRRRHQHPVLMRRIAGPVTTNTPPVTVESYRQELWIGVRA